MKKVTRVFSVFLIFFLITGAAFSGSTGDTTVIKYLVRFKGPSTLPAGFDHKALINHCQAVCAANLGHLNKFLPLKNGVPLWFINSAVVCTTPEIAKRIAELKNVAEIRPSTYRIWVDKPINLKAVKDENTIQWSISKVRAPEVWENLKIDGSGVVVGHLDTGIDAEHPALKGKVLAFKDFTNASMTTPYDDHGHGTHTAGSIAGSNGIGVAPGARLIVGKIFDKKGGADEVQLLAAMQWVIDPDGNPETDDAPQLVSNSWGSNSSTDKSFWDATTAWVTFGIVPVFAAGNSGPYGKVGIPGAYPHVWAVAATSKTDSLAYFSSVGPVSWDDKPLVKPDIAAPGAAVISAAVGGGLVSNSGTSMACPHVAGLVALMLQANPELTIAEVINIAESTAIDLGTAGKDNKFGSGRFDSFACVSKVVANSSPFASFKGYDQALHKEIALIGAQPFAPLSEPLAKSLITQGAQLDEGEFLSLSQAVSASSNPSLKALLAHISSARKHALLHQK